MGVRQTIKASLSKISIKSYLKNHWQGFLLAILALFSLISEAEISIYIFFYLSGFIYIHLFFGNKWPWLRKLLFAPLFSALVLIILCGMIDILTISIGEWCIYAVWAGALLISIIKPLRIKLLLDFKNNGDSTFVDIGLSIIFIIALLARILPFVDEYAPILHDPVAHAAWAKDIIETGHVNRFYSPGLHFVIGMATLTTKADYARTTLMITQYFNAMACLSSGIFIFLLSKRKYWALLAAAFFAVGGQPAALYTGAGKNALVFTFSFMFLTWAAIFIDFKKVYKIILCNLLLLTTILSHSPLAFTCVLGVFVIFLISKKKKTFLLLFVAAIVLGLVWGVVKLPYQIEHLNSSEENKHKNEVTISDILTVNNLKKEIINSFFALEDTLSLRSLSLTKILIYSGLILTLLLGLQDYKYLFLPVFYILYSLLKNVGLLFHSINPLGIITSTQQITSFIFSHMLISFSISTLLINSAKPLISSKLGSQIYQFFIILVLLTGLITGASELVEIYTYYQTTFCPIQQRDLETFEWMEDNLPDDTKFLVSARIYESANKIVVFAGDSGVWIPIYTDFEISSPFEEGFSAEAYENTKLYLALAEDPDNCEIRNEIIEKGFLYYFQGSKPVHSDQMIVPDEGFEAVYINGNASVYKIIPCNP